MDEFELIDTMVEILGSVATGAGVAVGPGDDAAVLEVPHDHQLVVSTDTLVAGRHFPANAQADVIGYRSMAVATSDLAAMGATPAYATVALTIEQLPEDWARPYAAGIAQAARAFGLAVVGGNVARGPCSITITVHGHVPAGQAITRAGAQPGELAYVTGSLGGASLALADAGVERCHLGDLADGTALRRYWMPTPRLGFAQALRGIATAAIDISDGLSSDLRHLCRASGVACRVDLSQLPVFAGCEALAAATSGDDYEIAFTAPDPSGDRIAALADQAGIAVQPIGTIGSGRAGHIEWLHDGTPVTLPRGYLHF